MHYLKYMIVTEPAKEKIQDLLSTFKLNTYFSITVSGDSIKGFHWNFSLDTSRSLNPRVPDAEVYISVDPFITTTYESYPALFDKILDFDRANNEFLITTKMDLG